MAFDRAMFATTATRAVRFTRSLDCFAQLPVLAPWHGPCDVQGALQHNGQSAHFLLNQGISLTEPGIFRVLPFLPSVDFEDLTVLLPFADLIVFSATLRLAAVAFDTAAFLTAFFAFETAFFTADFLAGAFFAGFFLAGAFFAGFFLDTMESSFFEIIALSPALTSPFSPALAIPAGDLIPASFNFFAVAFPTPGNANNFASGSFFGLAAISSPNSTKEAAGHNPCLN